MKKIRFFFTAAMAAILLGACSENRLTDPGDSGMSNAGSDKDGFYFSVNIDLPSAKGGRSHTTEPDDNGSTSNDGVEIGKDYENVIKQAIILLATNDDNSPENSNKFIAAAKITDQDLTPITGDKSSYMANATFSKTVLQTFYNSLPSTHTGPVAANIFLFCNPTQELEVAIFGDGTEQNKGILLNDNEWVNKIGEINTTSPIWKEEFFLMSNALIATRAIPGNMDSWNYYTTADKPFNLSANNPQVSINNGGTGRGAIKVERSSARFDFRDGSNNDFTYGVVKTKLSEDATEETTIVDIQLQKMALVNVSNKFYYLPHMVNPAIGSNGEYAIQSGTIDNATLKKGICTPELPWSFNADGSLNEPYGNYVLDTDYEWKNTMPTTGFNNHFIYPFFNENGTIDNNDENNDRWEGVLCEDVINKGKEDNLSQQYKIWRYATENTIPTIEGQTNGVSTGVVFKGKMIATTAALNSNDDDIKALAEAINNSSTENRGSYTDPIIYQFNGSLYLSWPRIRKAAIAAAAPEFKYDTETESWKLVNINRNDLLYRAVFGDGGFGEEEFTYTDLEDNSTKTFTYEDTELENATSPNTMWNKWNAAGKPGENHEATKNFKKAVTEKNISIYQTSFDKEKGWGYYCYYYYWNRHNSNDNTGVMGPMEFGVVRNNVYKLAVTKISKLGHPRISSNDPDKPKPDTKDENENVYLTVQADVLPWVVRVNDIEF